MGAHIVDGEFQSDKYPTTPAGKVPLSTKDTTAQDLLWEYAQRRRAVDAEFADDLEIALRANGYQPELRAERSSADRLAWIRDHIALGRWRMAHRSFLAEIIISLLAEVDARGAELAALAETKLVGAKLERSLRPMVEMIRGGEAENYVIKHLVTKAQGVERTWMLSLQRFDGMTPYEHIEKLKRERDEARGEVARLRAALDGMAQGAGVPPMCVACGQYFCRCEVTP